MRTKSCLRITGFLCFLVAFCLFSVGVSAYDPSTVKTVEVTVTMDDGEKVLIMPKVMEVASDTAEKFGYSDTIALADNVSLLDAFVAAHLDAYADFADDPGKYLEMSGGGWFTKAYGKTTGSPCTLVDGRSLGMANTVVLSGGEDVDFAQSISPTWDDHAAWFIGGSQRRAHVYAFPGQEISLTLKSFEFMTHSHRPAAELLSIAEPRKGVQLQQVICDEDGGCTLKATDYTTDDNGDVMIIAAEEPGDYIFMADSANVAEDFYCFKAFVTIHVVEPTKKVVSISMQDGDGIVLPPMVVNVSSDTAERYGYEDGLRVDTVSVLDALVEAHSIAYDGEEEEFTADPGKFLAPLEDKGGFLKVYGKETAGFFFTVNGESPHSDEVSGGGGFVRLDERHAPLAAGDHVAFDLTTAPMGADQITWFMKDGKRVDDLRIMLGDEVKLSLQSYFKAYAAYGTPDITQTYLTPVPTAQLTLVSVDDDGSTFIQEPLNGMVTDNDGNVTVKIADPGYYLIAAKVADPDNGVFRLTPFLTLNVVAPVNYSQMKDLVKGAWYEADVTKILKNGYMNGTSGNTFSPNVTLTRAMFVTILYRAAGEPLTPYYAPFEDYDPDDWSGAAIDWAYETGIVNGISEKQFAPKVAITREQMATIMARYADTYDLKLATDKGTANFTDADKISSWAKEPVERLVKAGVLKGMDNGAFEPKANATRAQAATVLCRFIGL